MSDVFTELLRTMVGYDFEMRVALVREGAKIPAYATDGAAGMDLYAAMDGPLMLGSLERAAIPTGVVIELPKGYEAQVRPRSGLSMKHGIGVVNSPGTIDSDYRSEVHVIVVNLDHAAYEIRPGDRIAQMIVAPVTKVKPVVVEYDVLTKTERGTGGLGSTGVR